MIRLEDVNETNWRYPLHVSEAQKEYVANPAVILARAYAYRSCRSRAFIVYNEETPIGMGLYYDCPNRNAYDFSQFFIDERYQGHGYGMAAAKLALNEMKRDGRYDKVILCYMEGNNAAKSLYEKLGFVETGCRDGEEILMELPKLS